MVNSQIRDDVRNCRLPADRSEASRTVSPNPDRPNPRLGRRGLGDAIRLDRRGAGLWLEGAALRDEGAEEGVFAV
jgi:hypothetical protein